jgi:hypothetical protein
MSDGTILLTQRSVNPSGTSGMNTLWGNVAGQIFVTNQAGGSSVILGTSACPAAYNSSGSAGQIAINGSYIYICYAPNTWGRLGLTSW